MGDYCGDMTDQPAADPADDSTPPPSPSVTTVTGYPGVAPTSQANPGVAGLRSAVSSVRVLSIASLALLVVVALGLVVGVASLRSQVDALSAQVSELATVAVAPAAAAEQPAAAAEAATQGASEAEQLAAAPALPDGTDLPGGVDPTGAILIGDANATEIIEVYVDYQCPFCQKWEQTVGAPLVERALAPGSGLLVKQYNLAFLGESSPALDPAGASARAASAAACVLDEDGAEVFAAFNTEVFRTADPAEPPTQFMAADLMALAAGVGASPAALACIEAETHVPFVAASTQSGFGRGVGGTPTVILNGRTLDNPFTDPTLVALATR